MSAELDEVRAELESLSYAISHDLAAPLRAVIGYSAVLAEDHASQLDPEGRRLLSIVSGEAARLQTMVDALLALSRFGSRPLVVEALDMAALACQVGAELGVAATVADRMPEAAGDRAMLRYVWSALLSNAKIATRSRSRADVTVSARIDDDGRVRYVVRDNGLGFDMKYAHKLFHVFQKLHRPDDFPGEGASLATAARIVRRHGGDVMAAARPDDGAVFSFCLPRPANV